MTRDDHDSSIAAVDAILRTWTRAGGCVPHEIPWTDDGGIRVTDVREALSSLLRTLAHCAQMTQLQEAVARNGNLADNGPCEDAVGFLRAADLVERVLSDDRIPDDCHWVNMATDAEIAVQWDLTRKGRSYLVKEIEAACPGWTGKVKDALRQNYVKTSKYLVESGRITAAPRGANDPNRHLPDRGFATRIERNKEKLHMR